MAAFIIRRLIWTIPVILLVILMTFVMMKQIGGNPFRRSERPVPPQVQENLERKFGLDEPWYEQYFDVREEHLHVRLRPLALRAGP